MDFGLTTQDLTLIKKTLANFPKIKKAIIFGSRAMGNYKKGSDIDITITGELTLADVLNISSALNETIPLPYFFDIIHYEKIKSQALKDHINQFGKTIYCFCNCSN